MKDACLATSTACPNLTRCEALTEWGVRMLRSLLCLGGGVLLSVPIIAFSPTATPVAAKPAMLVWVSGVVIGALLPILSSVMMAQIRIRETRSLDTLYFTLLFACAPFTVIVARYPTIGGICLTAYVLLAAVFAGWVYRESTNSRLATATQKLYARYPRALRRIEEEGLVESSSQTPIDIFRDELQSVQRACRSTQGTDINDECDALYRLCAEFKDATDRAPEKVELLHRMISFYLPTTRRLIGHFDNAQRLAADCPERATMMEAIEKSLRSLVIEFKKFQHTLAYKDLENLDVELTLLEAETGSTSSSLVSSAAKVIAAESSPPADPLVLQVPEDMPSPESNTRTPCLGRVLLGAVSLILFAGAGLAGQPLLEGVSAALRPISTKPGEAPFDARRLLASDLEEFKRQLGEPAEERVRGRRAVWRIYPPQRNGAIVGALFLDERPVYVLVTKDTPLGLISRNLIGGRVWDCQKANSSMRYCIDAVTVFEPWFRIVKDEMTRYIVDNNVEGLVVDRRRFAESLTRNIRKEMSDFAETAGPFDTTIRLHSGLCNESGAQSLGRTIQEQGPLFGFRRAECVTKNGREFVYPIE